MLFTLCSFYTQLLNEEIKDEIMVKIKDIQTSHSWSEFKLNVCIEDLKVPKRNLADLCRQFEIWTEIAKLSVDLWRDYEYYGLMTFENRYDNVEYKERLEDLGLRCTDGKWKCARRPDKESVQTNVFMYNLHKVMALNIIDCCSFCECVLVERSGQCEACYATVDQMLSHLAIKEIRKSIGRKDNNGDNVEGSNIGMSGDNGGVKGGFGVDDGRAAIGRRMADIGTNTTEGDDFVCRTEIGVQCEIISSVMRISPGEKEKDQSEGDKNSAFRGTELVEAVTKIITPSVDISLNESKKKEKMTIFGNNLESPYKLLTFGESDEEAKVKLRDGGAGKVDNKRDKWTCGKCECLNKYGSVSCDVCGALYREGRWRCGGCTMENSGANDGCDTCGTRNANIPKETYRNNADRNEGNERPSTRNDTPVVADKKDRDSQWTCGKCECINTYGNANCVACGALYREGRWRCGGCTMENSGANDECGACGRKNANIAVPVARGADDRNVRCCPKCAVRYEAGENACRRCDKQQKRETMDQWECGKCKISVSYGLKVCGGCHTSRAASGRWSCTKCTAVNTFRDNNCTVCYTANECIGVKYCVECRINKAREREERCDDCGRRTSIQYAPIRWKCGYTKCGEMNDDANQYCCKCRLHRLHPRGRGEVVKVSRDGDERVWICVKCGSFNELEDLLCQRCADTRYKRRYCKGCNKYNDGTSTNCDKCHRGLE